MQTHPLLLAAAALLLTGVLASKVSARIGVPSLLLFLGVGMLAGSDGIGGIEFDDFELARSFGIVALGFILFSGGLGTKYRDLRPVLGQGIALATIGVVLTAGVLGWLASFIVGLSIQEGLLLGAVIASTDSAAVFSILRSRGVTIDPKVSSTLELESGSNDPAAVFLTVTAIEIINGDSDVAAIIGSLLWQMSAGLVAGYLLARVMVWSINRLRLDGDGLYPVLTFAFVLITLEGVTAIGGSGFLALYVAGVTMAHHDYLHKRSLLQFHDAIAWMMQIAMFVLLGLLVFPRHLPGVAWQALLVAAVLMFVARPLAVIVTLLPFRTPIRHIGFVSWIGLRGATPIILATFPVAAAIPHAERIFNVVFFVVLASVLIQGATVAIAARSLGLTVDTDEMRHVALDVISADDSNVAVREMTLSPTSTAAGRHIVDLGLPPGLLVVLVRRGSASFVPQGSSRLLAGDTVLLAVGPHDDASVVEMFGESPGAAPDPTA